VLFASANPGAKEAVFKIAAKTQSASEGKYDWTRISNSLTILGYIAGEEDIDRMISLFGSHDDGTVSRDQHNIGQDLMAALGTMSLRGVDGAADRLREMSKCSYWFKKGVNPSKTRGESCSMDVNI